MIRWAHDSALGDNREGLVDPSYMDEVRMQTERREREYLARERRLEAAEKRHAAAAKQRLEARTARDRRRLEEQERRLWEVVEERRQELQGLASLASSHPQPSVHRGRKSFRPVPVKQARS